MIQFSIILPTTGRESLSKTIDSILDQTYRYWDLFIIGDGIDPQISQKDQRIHTLKINGPNNDSGATARNHGVAVSKQTDASRE